MTFDLKPCCCTQHYLLTYSSMCSVRLLIVTIASISRGKGVAQSLELGENGQAVHAHPTEKGSMTEDAPARLKHMTDTPTPEMDAKLAPAGEEAGALLLLLLISAAQQATLELHHEFPAVSWMQLAAPVCTLAQPG